MEEDKKQKDLLRRLPGVDRIFELAKVETLKLYSRRFQKRF